MGTREDLNEIPSRHWADHAADVLIRKNPDHERFVCASGISPSGVVHIGNFREVITVEFVVRALRTRGKQVRFIYSWDDCDALRKVPANLPNPQLLEKQLRKPLGAIPDPFGKESSYAAHFEKRFEREIEQLGIFPEYLYQFQKYRACTYTEGVKTALQNQDKIVRILNSAKTSPLPEDWSCASVFCEKCERDITQVVAYEPPTTLKYTCKCSKGETFSLDFSKVGNAKLLWRVDWPMRWNHEKVDFEPGGKDHSSTGGSYDTGKQLVKEIWNREPPHYVQYDFVMAKGLGAKLSSSSGNLITLSEALAVYEPRVVRWIFASRKPNLDFVIAFDLDVMKAYDDFDRCERIAFGAEEADEKKRTFERRIYELSQVDPDKIPAEMPAQFPLRHLCNILQIHQGDLDRSLECYRHLIKTPEDEQRFRARAQRAWKWITEFAPEAFRFSLRDETTHLEKTTFPDAVGEIAALLEQDNVESMSEDDLASRIYEVMKGRQLTAKNFFPEMYRILINKDSGPKLASFVLAIGPRKAASLLRQAL